MITVVSGLPRSGTSMMMQMLESSGMTILTDSIRKPDQNNERGYFEYEKVTGLQKDHSWIKETEEKAVKVIVQLLFFLPPDHEYRVLFMERPMEEILQSQEKMRQHLGNAVHGSNPDILSRAFQIQLERARVFLSNRQQFQVATFHYHNILKNPEMEANRINGFLGNRLNVSGLSSAVDQSLWHIRVKIS